MKKIALFLIAAFALIVVSCGPSAKELEEKRVADSIRVADSLAMVQAEQQKISDSVAKIKNDSIVKDSIAKVAKSKKVK